MTTDNNRMKTLDNTKAFPSSLNLAGAPAGDCRVIVQRRRRAGRGHQRRGIILIFVVVLLMLLAIMGTAYLATSRADRLSINSNGALAGTATPQLTDRQRLDTLFEATQRRVQNELIRDLFNVAPGEFEPLLRDTDRPATSNKAQTAKSILFSAFRQEGLPYSGAATDFNRYYYNYDAPGRADPHLSSLLPTRDPGGDIVWPWISAPLSGELAPGVEIAPFFVDPRDLVATGANIDGDVANIADGVANGDFFARQATPAERNAEADFALPVHNTQVLNRRNAVVLSDTMRRSDASPAAAEGARTTRVYPTLGIPDLGREFIAGDADGDGTADSGMSPVILNPRASGINRYLDSANGVVYFVSYRVVDNSAKVNVNTALSARSDFALPNGASGAWVAAAIKAATPSGAAARSEQPNLGFFRSNVGLTELIRNTLVPLGGGLSDAEIDRLLAARFPGLATVGATKEATASGQDSPMRRMGFANDPVSGAASTLIALYGEGSRNTFVPGGAAGDWYYRFSTFGDSVEQALARRPDNVGAVRVATGTLSTSALQSLPIADTLAFSAGGGGLLNARLTPAVTENTLLMSTRMLAPNFSGSTSEPWKWFPANQTELWFGWTKDFSLTLSGAPVLTTDEATANNYKIALLDGDVAGTPSYTRQYTFTAPASSGMTTVADMGRSIRPLLTTRNGVTSQVPMRYEGTGVPAGMPGYGEVTPLLDKYPAQKVSAATGTKEQLWRAFWSVMTQNKANPPSPAVTYVAEKFLVDPAVTSRTGYFNFNSAEVRNDPYQRNYDAFLPPDRHASAAVDTTPLTDTNRRRGLSRLNPQQMTLLRSAVAASNTIDLRDNDQDITAMTVDLGLTEELYAGDVLAGKQPEPEGNAVRNELYARVYGTEKQLVISAVVIDDNNASSPIPDASVTVGVELYNPTDEPIELDGYRLIVMNRGETPAGGVTTNDGYIYVDDNAGALTDAQVADRANDPTRILPVALRDLAVPTTLAPGGFVIIKSAALPADVPIQTENATMPPPRNPTDTTTADPLPGIAPPQVIYGPDMPHLIQLLGRETATTRLNRELVLVRTRRADGVAYRDHDYAAGPNPPMEVNGTYRRPTMNEDLTTVQGLSSLVPLDAVDCRSLDTVPVTGGNPTPPGSPRRYWYMRMTTPSYRFTPSRDAWKTFYHGRTFDVRPVRAPRGAVAPQGAMPLVVPTARPLSDYAWQEYDPSVAPVAVATLGVYRSVGEGGTVTPGTVQPFAAPTIPIQNGKPYHTFDPAATYAPPANEVEHPPFQFPYNSPFARNGDLLNIPFIGTYKIYRVEISGPRGLTTPTFDIAAPDSPVPPALPNRALYEYVPLSMDAVNVAPDPTEWGVAAAVPNPSVGRFDARPEIYPRNDWAADLFDYVVARQPEGTERKFNEPWDSRGTELAFPDVPASDFFDRSPNDPNPPTLVLYNNPMVPATDQDGPVLSVGDTVTAPGANGSNPTANYATRVPWIAWRTDAATPAAVSTSRVPNMPMAKTAPPTSKLIPGVVNLNTAPPLVLRMLPWTAAPTTGFVDQDPGVTTAGGGSNAIQRQRVGAMTHFLTSTDIDPDTTLPPNTPTGKQLRPINAPPFGLTNLTMVSQVPKFANDDARLIPLADPATTNAGPGSHLINQSLMRMGMLNPQHRADINNDFHVTHLNMTRVSNLTSQRSDAYTVYVTVQAWTYVPGNNAGNPAQLTDTRLVGERRGSFVVDRSRISQTAFKPSDLLIYPVEQE